MLINDIQTRFYGVVPVMNVFGTYPQTVYHSYKGVEPKSFDIDETVSSFADIIK